MPKVEWIGEPGLESYHGLDGVELLPGEPQEISDEKAAQLAADFPHLVSIDGKAPAKKATAPAPAPDVDDPAADAGDAGEDDLDEPAADAQDDPAPDDPPAEKPRSRRKR